MIIKSILDIEVSCFKNYWEEKHPRNVNLLTWLTSTKYQDKVEAIRSIDDKKKRDAIKATLPAITPSGIFSYRSQSKLIQHSGLIQIDIDLTKKNLSIRNWDDLKFELIKIPNIAYLGASVSGRGYWGLIPIPPEPENQKRYFDALYDIFLNSWGIELDDKPKNVASLRGYSFDSKAYFNHEAKPFLIKKSLQSKPVTIVKNKGVKSSGLGDWIVKKLEASQDGERHGNRLKLARYAGGLVASGSLCNEIEKRLIQSYLRQYGSLDSRQVQAKEIKAIQDGFKDGLSDPIALPDYHRPTFQKTEISINRTIKKPHQGDTFENYISHLHFENGLLLNGMGYPADWDLIGSYADQKTKDFIRMALKNPLLIELRSRFDLL